MTQFRLDGPRQAPASGETADSLIIFLHGYGSNGADLIGLAPYWERLLPNTAFVSPNAPEPLLGFPEAYQWFGLTTMDPDVIARSAAAVSPILNDFIAAEMERCNVKPERTVLVGFSQGTMMALEVGLKWPNAFAGIIGFSGALVGFKAAVSKPPILLIHGDQDDRVPHAASVAAVAALSVAGIDARLHSSPNTGHSIAMDGLQAAAGFLKAHL